MKKRYLVLENGTVFEGYAFGADAVCVGELVFNTGVCGYTQALTDESYLGQILLQTFPMIGNYGVNTEDIQGECKLKGYAVHEICDAPSNFRCEMTIDDFLKKQNVPGIYGIDTRAVTKLITKHGVMNAMLCDSVPEDISTIAEYKIADALSGVSTKKSKTAEDGKYKVTLVDYGTKCDIIDALCEWGCSVKVVGCDFSAQSILDDSPDGVVLSAGPGDPSENTYQIGQIGELVGKLPILAVGLGHEMLALSEGAQVKKMKCGHRGANQPSLCRSEGRTYVTSQNHGYEVVAESVVSGRVSFVNVNDGGCEGIDYPEKNAFSVQFEPDSGTTPFVFEKFISLMEGKNASR